MREGLSVAGGVGRVFLAGVAFVAIGAAAARDAAALVITPDFSGVRTVYQSAAGTLSGSGGAGFTDVTAAFQADINAGLAYLTNAVLIPDWRIAIAFELAPLLGVVADSTFSSTDANGRPDVSTIRFSTLMADFVDPTPLGNSEFTLSSRDAALGGGAVNVARFGDAVPGGPAAGRYDVLTTVLHEAEHSLGYHSELPRYAAVVPTSGPGAGQMAIPAALTGLPSGFVLPMDLGVNNSHIDGVAQGGLFNDNLVAHPGFGTGQRGLLSATEIYGLCVIAGCTRAQVNTNPSASLPEPGTLTLVMAGLLGLAWRRRPAATV